MHQHPGNQHTSSLLPRHSPLYHLKKHPGAAAVFGALALFSMVAAFGLQPPSISSTELIPRPVIEDLALALAHPLDLGNQAYLREEKVQKGDSLANLLNRLGVNDASALDYIKQTPAAHPIFRQLAPGKLVTASTSDTGELLLLSFPLNNRAENLLIERLGNTFRTREAPLALQSQLEMKSGEIRSSLYGATDDAGIPDAVANQLAEIFGADIDFHRDLRKGDHFTLIYEMYRHQGQSIRSGRILAAELVNAGKVFRAVYFEDPKTSIKGSYYTPEGKSLRKAFLRSPLEFSRITSGFTNARLHPILQQWRAHKGVDYGAPTGTKVRATGDGTVEFIGRQGGYGNLIILRHQGRYSTAYGHLSSFTPQLRKGSRVSQGEHIGNVGATGWATGPHLHYEFRIGGEQVNPLAVQLPGAPSLETAQLLQFRQKTRDLLAQLEMLKQSDMVAFQE
ncbi:M23 family metallopeptidase [Azospira oryzae]|uniref:M23 family metallopeptidase n=1 Tax=Azospira oryzae TaxID=146939 RepID=UPI001965B14A|nr:peptidoglycan DD-metalloendopeptidase family protein [Azospira oryzae]